MTSGLSNINTPTHLFKNTIDLLRPTVTLDSGGSPVRSYSAWRSNVASSVQPRSDTVHDPLVGRRVYKQVIRIYLNPAIEIEPTDRIVFDGKTYEQTGSGTDILSSGIIRRLDCREIIE